METPDFLRSLDQKLSTYQPSEATMLAIGGATILLALGPLALTRTSFLNERGGKIVRPRTTADVSEGDLALPISYEEVLAGLESGEYVTASVDEDGNFTGTLAEDYSQDEPVTVVSSISRYDQFEELGVKEIIPIYLMPASTQAFVEAIKAKSPSLENTKSQIAKFTDTLKTAMERKDVRYVIFEEPQDAGVDLHDVVIGKEQTPRYVARAKSIGKMISQLSR